MKHKITISPLIKEIELRKTPVIIRVNKFDEESAKKFASEMATAHNTGQDIIPVVIDSYGGQVYSLMAMIGSIKNASLPVATITSRSWSSSQAVLTALTHFASNQIVYKMMAKNCGHPDDYFLELVHSRGHADWFLDAKETKRHGLANHLRLPTLEIEVGVKIKMR